jgi:ribonuclease P protein component
MLKKEQRIAKKKEFDLIFQAGRSSYDGFIGVKALKNPYSYCRYGFIISAKVSKLAVERNKTRRRLREIFGRWQKLVKIPVDIVVIVLPKAKNVTFKQLEESVLVNLKRLRLL